MLYDGICGFFGDDLVEVYFKEYMELEDWDVEFSVVWKMVNVMDDVGFVEYMFLEFVFLYLILGVSIDYMWGLYYGDKCGVKKLKSLIVEFGWFLGDFGGCFFYLIREEYYDLMRSVDIGFMELLLNVVGLDGELVWKIC